MNKMLLAFALMAATFMLQSCSCASDDSCAEEWWGDEAREMDNCIDHKKYNACLKEDQWKGLSQEFVKSQCNARASYHGDCD
jgi:hypothetical protein